jgi:two-component system, sensor histidine kinase RegB
MQSSGNEVTQRLAPRRILDEEQKIPAADRIADGESNRINFSWILKLRWGAIAGQLATITYVERFMGIDLPLAPLLVILCLEIASNFACVLWLRHTSAVDDRLIGAVMVMDVMLLTALLFFTGGPFNPFSFLYLVHVALGAVVLRSWWTWGLFVLSLACLGALFLDHRWLALGWQSHPAHHAEHMGMHLRGMWFAMAVAGLFIVYFVTRVRRDLARRDTQLARARRLVDRSERLSALATLATGAAHEISTPLSTITVATRELELALARHPVEPDVIEDVRLIRREVERCRDVLQQLATDAGQSAGEPMAPIEIVELIGMLIDGLPGRERVRVTWGAGAREKTLYGPRRALAQALRGVLRNAEQAAPPPSPIDLRISHQAKGWTFEVEDAGTGMDENVLRRAGEPFFTTKEPGRGLGLGLFLTRRVLEGMGGDVEFDSLPGRGTRVRLSVPAPAASVRHEAA